MLPNFLAAWPLGLALVARTHPAAASHLARGRHFVRAPQPAPVPAPAPAPAPVPGMVRNDGSWSDHDYFMPLALGAMDDWDPAAVDHDGSVRHNDPHFGAAFGDHLTEKLDSVLYPPPKAEDYPDKDDGKKQKREVAKEEEEDKVPMHRIGKLVGRPLGPHKGDDNNDNDKKTDDKKNDKRSTGQSETLVYQTNKKVLIDPAGNPISLITGILKNDDSHTRRNIQTDRQLGMISKLRVAKVKNATQCTSDTDEHACDRFFLLEMLLDNDHHERLKMGLAAARDQKLKANKTRIHDINTQTSECGTNDDGENQTCYTTSFLIEYLAAVNPESATEAAMTNDNNNKKCHKSLDKRMGEQGEQAWRAKFADFLALSDWVGDALFWPVPGRYETTSDCVE